MSEGHRKRGVQASRAKLNHALNKQGLRSQAALAERIAEQHELERAPKEMVSRAFREQPIDHTSLERIAQALDTPAYELMLSSDEVDAQVPAIEQASNSHTSSRVMWVGLVGAIAALLVVGTLVFNRGVDTRVSYDSVVVRSIGDSGAAGLVSTLRTRLAEETRVASATAAAYDEIPSDLVERLRVDAVIDIDLVVQRRMAGVRVFVYSQGQRQLVWMDSAPRVALAGLEDEFAAAIKQAILVGKTLSLEAIQAQDDYLLGEYYLDEPSSELNIKRAESRFQAALRVLPDYAVAHAGLCQALLESYWMMDESRMLEDAGIACLRAKQLDDADPLIEVANAHLSRRRGQLDKSLEVYERVVRDYPHYPSAHQGLAAALLDKYREAGEGSYLEAAARASEAAGTLDSQLWKPYFNLGLMAWFQGDIEGAIAANEKGLARHQNEMLLANLGSLYVCVGAFDKARDAYIRADQLAPESYVGREFLGMIYYFLGDYAASIKSRREAIEAIASGAPELHEMWGYLADAHLAHGETEAAVEAYRRAVDIAERDYVTGYSPVTDNAHRAYYYLRLEALAPETVEKSTLRLIQADLDNIDAQQIESAGHRRMTQIWQLVGDQSKARASLAKATQPCTGYAQLPEFAGLRQE